ncbi:tubulin glycylase 3B isoform X1 [Lucilia cuprina]|uniref:tubulin glycylase 3B isoform X1 n=1 Tax=Lucilia cuprina TaxID=7375 RepID=UPI001F06E0B1|nr:tubulin glycylase 3B isoform X1 [Lucilia cuprina]XP_046801229.1 tubulin glycylase 3B isoform X1 [Lucilia cuprina]
MLNSSMKLSSSFDTSGRLVHNQNSVITPMVTVKHQDSMIIPPKTLSSMYRAKVIDAYRNRRIFTIFGNYNTIRRSLLKRGWLEKLAPGRHNKLQGLSEEVLLQHARRGNDYEAVAISKIINHLPAFFVWQPKAQRDLYMDVHPYRNRIRRTHAMDFSTKVGLIGCAEQQHWFHQDGVAGMLYPRFFRLGANQEEQMAFTDEFRITQCASLLRYLLRHLENHKDIIDYEKGTICPTIVHFALARVKRQLDDWDNIGLLDIEQSQVPEEEWNSFLDDSSKVINGKQKIKCTYRELTEFIKTSTNLLTRMEEKHPDRKWDGYKNLWILKPGYQSRGLGIVIRNSLNEILSWCTNHTNRRYIVQKYIEQPLLIYRTKFDIRQYMLVFIRESTVQIWLYTDCYLRFSSQEYSIDDLRECIHLTNNSVQKKYKNKSNRDPKLPKQNMWSLEQFKAYLKTQNVPEDTWNKRVYSGFRENLIAVVLASLDETNLNENSFELYGCDFMLDEQYNPILIEINSTPDLSPSTDVTARICPMVMQDCVKVIVDLPLNSRASTGLFEMVYEVNYKFKQQFNNTEGLNVSGKSVELTKRPCIPTKPKLSKKPKMENKTQSKTVTEIKSPKISAVLSKKSKASMSNMVSKSLKAAAKEALALRYTMPK